MSGLTELLTVADTAQLLSVSTKTVRRMLARGDLVAHRLNRNLVRVNGSSVMRLLAGSRSLAVDMRTMENDSNGKVARLYRQRGRGRCWTALVGDEEVPLGTPDRGEAETRLSALIAKSGRRKPWRVYRDQQGWHVKYYDAEGKRRMHRVPADVMPPVEAQDDAEAYANSWWLNRGRLDTQAPATVAPAVLTLDPHTTFREFGNLWTSGKLAELFPDDVGKKASSGDDNARLETYVYPLIGDRPLSAFEAESGLRLVEPVKVGLAKTELSRASRRHVLQSISRLLNLAVYPARILPANPLPRGFIPSGTSAKAKTYLLPDEDRLLLACTQVSLLHRFLFGVLAREGLRVSEALALTWADLDLDHGVLHLDENKTDDPRSWALDPGVTESFRRWKRHLVKSTAPQAPAIACKGAPRPDKYELSRVLRSGLRAAGVTRSQIFENSEKRIALRAHDLRATFVTVSLALGKSETWVSDRTGHKSTQMIALYHRQARSYAELNLGPLTPLYEAVPELDALKP